MKNSQAPKAILYECLNTKVCGIKFHSFVPKLDKCKVCGERVFTVKVFHIGSLEELQLVKKPKPI